MSGNGSGSSSGSDSEDGQDYLEQLSRKQVLEINAAFDRAANPGATSGASQSAAKRRKVDKKGKGKATKPAAGGFLLEDDGDATAGGGGGFLPEEDEPLPPPPKSPAKYAASAKSQAKSVLLDEIPSILDSLGLEGDDTSILSIFENASEPNADGLAVVKRMKFLKVAAILIAQRDEEEAILPSSSAKKGKVHSGGGKGRAVRMDVDEEADEHDDSDPLVLSSDEEEDDDDPQAGEDSDPWADEDDLDGAFQANRSTSPASTRRTTRSRAAEAKSASPEPGKPLTAAQKGRGKAIPTAGKSGRGATRDVKLSADQRQECEKMFHQFFNSSDKSRNRAISLAEIRFVATLLNEKISDADVCISLRCFAVRSRLILTRSPGRRDARVCLEYEGQDRQSRGVLENHGRSKGSVA